MSRILTICLLLLLSFSLNGCKEENNNSVQNENSNQGKQIEEIDSKSEDNEISPDRRLKAFVYEVDGDNKKTTYRITVADTEQSKIIFSQEYALEEYKSADLDSLEGKASQKSDSTGETKKNEKTSKLSDRVKIEKLFDDLVIISEKKDDENYVYKAIHPDSNEIKEIKECLIEGKSYKNFKIINFSEAEYECEAKSTANGEPSNELSEDKEFKDAELLKGKNKWPEFDKAANPQLLLNDSQSNNPQSNEQKLNQQKLSQQVKSSNSFRAELSPFNLNKEQTDYGQRVELKVYKDNKLLYIKRFSGKCTGCKWINQDNWKEAFRIEQVEEDKVLLTQLLKELDPPSIEPLYASLLIIPSQKKLIHLDCSDKGGDSSYVSKIKGKTYECERVNTSSGKIVLPLPEN
jgi:hypothetical protein